MKNKEMHEVFFVKYLYFQLINDIENDIALD